MPLARLLLFGGVVVAALGFILYQILKFYWSINNPTGVAKRDGSKLREAVGPFLDILVPYTSAEMELLSLDSNITRKKKSGFIQYSGYFNSIYNEPLVAFAMREYTRKNVRSLLVRTTVQEFFYISMKGETQVYQNGKALGVITSTGDFYAPNRKQLLAHLSPEDVLTLHPVTIGNREVGRVLNPLAAEEVSPRAFQYLEEMDEWEETLFLGLSFLSIVEETLVAKGK